MLVCDECGAAMYGVVMGAVAFVLCWYDWSLHGFVLYLLVYLPIRVVYGFVLDALVLGPRNTAAALMNTNTNEQQSNTHTHIKLRNPTR